MANKRKNRHQPQKGESITDAGRGGSQLRIDTYEDVADSEDEFHINREKILLEEEPAAKKQRKWQEQGMNRRFRAANEFLERSDEEVLAFSSDPSEDDVGSADAGAEEELNGHIAPPNEYDSQASDVAREDEYDLGAWGSKKRDYYDADKIETEQDALEEEMEARRLQQKRLAKLTEADFFFDRLQWHGGQADTADNEGSDNEADERVITEILPEVHVTNQMAPEERLKVLKNRYPEFEPLARELVDLQSLYNDLALRASTVERNLRLRPAKFGESVDSVRLPLAIVKYQALAAYLAALSMYFAILTSTAAGGRGGSLAMLPTKLRDHPVMDSLVKCRELWSKLEPLTIPEDEVLRLTENVELDIKETEVERVTAKPVSDGVNCNGNAVSAPRKQRKSKAQRALEAVQATEAALRVERLRKTEAALAHLSTISDFSVHAGHSKSKSLAPPSTLLSSVINDKGSDLGEESLLAPHEVAEKAARRKSLRFYTSQIAQKANKRGAADRDAGGDTDLPYRERLRDRQARLNAEAERRGRRKKDDIMNESLGGESDDDDRRVARELRAEAAEVSEDENGYYQFISAHSKAKKAEKTARAAAYAEAAAEGASVIHTEVLGDDGKRKISYAIEKNKGLTPRRKKEVRNPRVKKRKKFEEKKKKLASMRPVYKGGEARGGYGGELTGIKSGLVRSVKL